MNASSNYYQGDFQQDHSSYYYPNLARITPPYNSYTFESPGFQQYGDLPLPESMLYIGPSPPPPPLTTPVPPQISIFDREPAINMNGSRLISHSQSHQQCLFYFDEQVIMPNVPYPPRPRGVPPSQPVYYDGPALLRRRAVEAPSLRRYSFGQRGFQFPHIYPVFDGRSAFINKGVSMVKRELIHTKKGIRFNQETFEARFIRIFNQQYGIFTKIDFFGKDIF